MLSSFRKRPPAARAAAAGTTALAAAAIGTTAEAAQYYYQPIASLSAGYNTNTDLDPTTKTGAVSYLADVATNFGIATPRSETTLQPRLVYNYYPTITRRNRLEGFLNGNTRYSWERDRFSLSGFFDHRDDVNAEQPSAVDNPINPGVGEQTPSSGVTKRGVVRNYTILDPTFVHLLTPLSSIGIAGDYQRMDYSPSDSASHADFNYYQGRLYYAKTIDLRTDFAIGAYGSRYQSGSADSHANSYGLQVNGGYNWSQVWRSDLTVQWQRTQFEQDKIQDNVPVTVDARSNPWAANLNTTYKQQASSYHLNFARSIYPGSTGGLFRTDQIRGQYDRDFSERLSFTGAVRYFRQRTILGSAGDDTRKYGTATVRMQYMMTQTFFVAGSYTYVWQKYTGADAAYSNNVLVSFGYRGIQRQR
jgi:hypothetical protein